MISAVLFDLDGTLVDTAPDFVETLNRLTQRHNLPMVDEPRIRNTVSDGASALIALAFSHLSEHKQQAFKEELLNEYDLVAGQHCSLFKGLEDVLLELESRSIPWGIVTNKPERFAKPLIDQLFFNAPGALVCPDHVNQPKPSPEALFLACKMMKVSPDNAVYIGDHPRDIDSGRAAGMRTIIAGFGYIKPEEDTSTWGATELAHTPQDIWPILQSFRE